MFSRDRTKTALRPQGSRGNYKAFLQKAAAILALSIAGVALLTACSTVGAIPGVLLTPAAPAAQAAVPLAPPDEPKGIATDDPVGYLATFTTRLAGSNEKPQTFSMGTGSVDALLDTKTHLLRWKMSFSNLSGPPLVAHFHGPAEIGANAGVTLAFPMPLTSPYEGRATLTTQQMTDLLSDKWYVNLHTAKNPDGEVRGQMIERR